jgi:hypothetical protein
MEWYCVFEVGERILANGLKKVESNRLGARRSVPQTEYMPS